MSSAIIRFRAISAQEFRAESRFCTVRLLDRRQSASLKSRDVRPLMRQTRLFGSPLSVPRNKGTAGETFSRYRSAAKHGSDRESAQTLL